mgnify:CR=1 FL=1
MKKLSIIFILNLIFFTSMAHSLDIKSGHMLRDNVGNKLYYSLLQKKYIDCEAFNYEGSTIEPEITGGLTGGQPICEGWIFGDGKSELDFKEAIPINSDGNPANLKVLELVFGYELRIKKKNEYSEFVSGSVWKWDGKKFLKKSDWKNKYSNSRKVDFSKLEGIWHATCIDVDTEETFRCPTDVVKEFFKDEQSLFTSLQKYFESSKITVSEKKSRDVKGKKLWCTWNGDDVLGVGLEFNNNNKAKLKGIDDDNEKLITINGKYQALSDKIIINYKNLDNSDEEMIISRKTLKIQNSSRSSCKPINKSSSIDNKLKRALDKLISEKSSENKF